MGKWGGWIPSLSGDLFLEDSERFLRREKHLYDKDSGCYFKYVIISDSVAIEKVILTIFPPKIKNNEAELLVEIKDTSVRDKTVYCKAKCCIYQNGFFFAELEPNDGYEGFEGNFALLFYKHAKDL